MSIPLNIFPLPINPPRQSTDTQKAIITDSAIKSDLNPLPNINNPSTITPPDDFIGDIMPFILFKLTNNDNFQQEVNRLADIIDNIPNKNYNIKFQFINKIPTGVIKPI